MAAACPGIHSEKRKPPQSAENARTKVTVGSRDRADILRHAAFAVLNNVPGEISLYVQRRMDGRFSEAVIDRIIAAEFLVRDRQVAASRTHVQGHMQMLREVEQETRGDLEGAA